jgi:hypothetical protein
MVSPTLQTHQDPILLLPGSAFVCFAEGRERLHPSECFLPPLQEPSALWQEEEEADEYTVRLARSMNHFRPEHILAGDYMLTDWNETLMTQVRPASPMPSNGRRAPEQEPCPCPCQS